MKNRYFLIITFLFVAILFSTGNISAQQENLILIGSVVNDESGNPVPNAEVFSGNAYTKTDATGRFSILIDPESRLVIEAKGFETKSVSSYEAERMSEISLEKSPYLYGTSDKIQLAFKQDHKGDLVGAVAVLNVSDVDKIDNTIWANDILNGRTLGLMGSNSIRGIGIGIDVASLTGTGLRSGNAIFIVDGLPRDIDYLRASEIESITVLKDINSSILYGSAAVNGVVLITTKRGEAFKSSNNITVSSGLSIPRAMPNYLNSADYMEWYNIARANDGQAELFTPETIENHRTGNPYRYPDIDYFSDEYLKSAKNYTYVETQFSGGNDDARFYSNIGWNSEGGLLDFGEGATARNNIFNARGNVDLKVSDKINTSIDGSAIFVQDSDARGNYWGSAHSIRPYEYTPLLPFNLIDPEISTFLARKNDVDGRYLLGGNTTHRTHTFGDGYSGGGFERIERNFAFNNRINVDLGSFTEGLSFHTNISFDYYVRYNQTIANEYSVYSPTWIIDENSDLDYIVGLTQIGVDRRPGSQVVGNTYFRRRFGAYAQMRYDRLFDGIHHIKGSFLGYSSNFKQQGSYQGVKQANLGLQLSYIYDRKYMIDFSSAYVNSVKLPEGNKGAFSPSIGLAWMISSEDFMASAANVDYLKLRLSGGILHTDLPIGGFYYYDNRYGGSGSYNWYEDARSRGGVISNYGSNPDLGFAKREEVTFGFEGLFFQQVLGFEANVFHNVYSDLVTRPNTAYPGFFNDFIPWENFNADKYQGAELGLTYNKSFGDFGVFIGANALYVTSERTKVDEFYDNDYQYRQGQPRDASFGLEAIGLFSDQADIDASPIQAFGDVRPGDIKYKDQNGDGIVDSNDEVYLRRWQAPLSGGLQLQLSYRNVSLYVLGEGRMGSETFREGNYYWADGNKKYSDVVLGSWTETNSATATYPRLSSVTNSNNNRRSSYWLYSNDYFQVRRIQLTYSLPESVVRSLSMRDMSIFVDASNLTQFAPNKDIRDLSTSGEPNYKTFSLGLKANF